MKFLCDVHISYKIGNFLSDLGHDAIHVNTILDKWQTKDRAICKYADLNEMIVVTKDYDFRDSFFLSKTPKKLIKINLGNISTNELIDSLSNVLPALERLNASSYFMIEIGKSYTTFIDNAIDNIQG